MGRRRQADAFRVAFVLCSTAMLGAVTLLFSLAQDAGAVTPPPYDPAVTHAEANADAAANGVPRHPVPQPPHGSVVEEDDEPTKPRASEGRRLAVIANTKLQILLTPGIVFVGEKPGVFFGVRAGWGVDLRSVIVVPGLRLAGYFTDPAAYVAMPVGKVILPLGRFAPFLEAGFGIGHVTSPGKTGASLFGGGGMMVHFSEALGLGVGASYEVITSTPFSALGIGPLVSFKP
jgi:hypothetical protein